MGNRLPSPEGEGGTTPNDRFARSERAARTGPDPILEDRVPPAPVTPRRGNPVDWEHVMPTIPIASARPGGAAAAALAVRLRDRRADTGVLAIFPSSHLGSDCTAASAAATAAKVAAGLGESRNWQAQSINLNFFKKNFLRVRIAFRPLHTGPGASGRLAAPARFACEAANGPPARGLRRGGAGDFPRGRRFADSPIR